MCWRQSEGRTVGELSSRSLHSEAVIPNQGWSALQETFGTICKHLWLSQLSGQQCYGHLVGRGKDATQHSIMHRRAPTTNNYPVPNAKDEKWWSTGSDTEHCYLLNAKGAVG